VGFAAHFFLFIRLYVFFLLRRLVSPTNFAISFLSLVKNEVVQPRFQGPPEKRTESFC
jgi:hypothetical protein